MELGIYYQPHPKQDEVHRSFARFRVIAAGRRSGKTTCGINEIIKQALMHPDKRNGTIPRSWFLCKTYRQAKTIGFRLLLNYLPSELIRRKSMIDLEVELINGHLIEFKGADVDPDSLRGVALCFVVLDEYGFMNPTVWDEIIRPSLADMHGRALFIGTPGPDGSPHFQDIYNKGRQDGKLYRSWLFYTTDNPNKEIQADALRAKSELPRDIYEREFEANFNTTSGLIYDNFRHSVHVIPNYEPNDFDFIVGSIDPGLHNPTGAILCAWDRDNVGRIFKEYYVKERLAEENALNILELAKPYKVSYWIIDSASSQRDPASGMTVYNKYKSILRPLMPSRNDQGSVWAGIDEVKKLLHIDEKTGRPRLYVTNQCHNWLWEVGKYIRYKRKWFTDRNVDERPRKLNDHLMDCSRNMVYSKPWMRPSLKVYEPVALGY